VPSNVCRVLGADYIAKVRSVLIARTRDSEFVDALDSGLGIREMDSELPGHAAIEIAAFFGMTDSKFVKNHKFYANPCSLSPQTRKQPPADASGVIGIARQLSAQHAVLSDGAIQQKRQAPDHQYHGRDPGAERNAACHHDDNAGGIARMPDDRVRPGCHHDVTPVGLDPQ
jgi:hypothetical protein